MCSKTVLLLLSIYNSVQALSIPQNVNYMKHEVREAMCKDQVAKVVKLRKDLFCRPILTVVQLENGYEPTAILVNRCGGICEKFEHCVPDETRNATFPVLKFHLGKETCGEIAVEEHVSCKCKNTDCETFPNQHHCKNCKNKNGHHKCGVHNKSWDDKACVEKECTTTTKWDSKNCRCTSR